MVFLEFQNLYGLGYVCITWSALWDLPLLIDPCHGGALYFSGGSLGILHDFNQCLQFMQCSYILEYMSLSTKCTS